ncbi:hypothetical protein [uncultured Aquimarina sp.]|uniref:hypothetical protein n=1 Tax=uncultured Aquimarina sp. TaxID=575652 RepID=UPI002611CBEB|nr:hypothetical protein [uncultured Aquimarina sp.]
MKYNFLILLLILMLQLSGQEAKLSDDFILQIGEEYEETVGGVTEFYSYKQNVIKLANHNGYDLVIQKLDPLTLKEVERIEKVNFFKGVKKGKFRSVVQVADKAVFFFHFWDKKNKKTLINVRTVSLTTLEVSDFRTVLNVKGEISIHSFNFKTSFDERKLVTLCKLKSQKGKGLKNVDRFSIHVFDDNVDEIWNKDVNLPYMKTVSMNLDFSIDNDGSFYFLTRVYEDEKSKKKKPFLNPNSHIELLELHKDSDEFISSKIEVQDYFVDMASIGQTPEDGVVVTGTLGKIFYVKKKESLLTPIGFFFAKYGKDNGLKKVNSYDFSDKILNKYKEDKRLKKNEVSKFGAYFKDLKITNVVYSDDGSILLIGEQSNLSSRNVISASIGYTHTSVSIRLDDIFIAKILADGTLGWLRRLPKQQRVDNRGASEMSFEYVGLNDHHYLFYQDHIANLNRPEDESPSPLWDLTTGYLMAYRINDATGVVKKEAVFNLADVNNGKKLEDFITNNILRISGSEIVIEGFNGDDKDFLVKVTAKK